MTSRHAPRAVARVLLSVTTLLGLLAMNIALLPNARAASTTPTFDLMWGATGTGNGQFKDPRDMAVDSQGNVYVADSTNWRVQKFDSTGAFMTSWGSYGTTPANFRPIGVAVDTSDKVYVSDSANGRILKFDGNGGLLGTFSGGQMSGPAGMAFDAQGNLYVVDNYGNSIHKFDNADNYLRSWGSSGSGAGQLLSPFGITVDSTGNVYVAEQGNNRIQKFNSAGASEAIWNTYSGVADIAVDSSGAFYVTNPGNHRILKRDGTGALVATWGSYGTGASEFNAPVGLALSSDNKLYVSEGGNNRIQKFAIPTNTAPSNPGMPTLASGSLSPNRGAFGLTWTAAIDNEGNPITYELQHKDANDADFSSVATLTTNNHSFTTATPENEGTWTYQVRASDGTLQSVYSSASTDVKVDKSAPTAPTASFSKAPQYSAAGVAWYKDSVEVSYTGGSDLALVDGSAGSGIDPTSYTAAQVLSIHGANSYSGTVKDQAGNESSPMVGTVNVDTSNPVVSLTCPNSVRLKSKASASWTATDTGSGVASGYASGSIQLNTSTTGWKTATVPAGTSKDNVGHTSDMATCQYQVVKR